MNETPQVESKKTNGMAIASLILSIIGISIVGVILGIVALNQIKKTGEEGRGLALAGIIVGAIGFVLTFIWIAVIFLAVAVELA